MNADCEPGLGSPSYRALIASDRVSSGTREALVARARRDDPAYVPVALSLPALQILRAVMDRVIPQAGATRIDLAARIDAELGIGVGDGWRRVELPPDKAAYQMGLRTLDDYARWQCGDEFVRLDDRRQDELLQRMASKLTDPPGTRASAAAGFDTEQMRLWFEDLRADAVRLFVAHPQTLFRMGYGGFANGGDGQPKSGFRRVGVAEREAWEPVAQAELTL